MIITLMHWPPRRRSNRTGSRSRPPASAPNTAPQPFLSDPHWLLIADVLADPPPSANIGGVHAIETLADQPVPSRTPKRLIYDKAADADWLRETLGVRGIALICPHRANRQKPPLQDGRAMRRYKRRFKVERSLSWLHNSRRLLTRWEYDPELLEGFVHLAWLFTLLKGF